jgi:glycosyltransferase involved in cell wall biosynthesis
LLNISEKNNPVIVNFLQTHMKIWLINPYGPIPSEAWRTYCFPQIAEALTSEGHEVTWWTSNFAHHFKKFRSHWWQDIEPWEGFRIRLVPTPGYRRNIGFARVFRDVVFALRTYRRGCTEPKPDLIIYSESPLTFGFAGQRLADFHGCPSIYHQMDLWPELIVDAAPRGIRRLVKLGLWPVYAIRKRTYSRLSAVTALAQPYLNAVLNEVPELLSKPNNVIYNGIDVVALRKNMDAFKDTAFRFPDKQPDDLWAVFAGSLGPSYDIIVMCDVARRLAVLGSKIHVVIAGDGPLRQVVESTSRGETGPSNLHYVGQLSPLELAGLYARCDLGLCAYSSSSNVEMPDKIYDYTAAGLPVLVSLRGEVADIVSSNKIGLTYSGGSAEDLLRKLLEITADTDLMHAMSESSLELGMRFDKHVQYRKFIDVIRQVTNYSVNKA